MREYDESAVVQFFGLFNMLTVEGCSEKVLFNQLTNNAIRGL